MYHNKRNFNQSIRMYQNINRNTIVNECIWERDVPTIEEWIYLNGYTKLNECIRLSKIPSSANVSTEKIHHYRWINLVLWYFWVGEWISSIRLKQQSKRMRHCIRLNTIELEWINKTETHNILERIIVLIDIRNTKHHSKWMCH